MLNVFAPIKNEISLEQNRTKGRRKEICIWKVDYVDPLGFSVPKRAKLIIVEDNDAVISTVIKGRSMVWRHI